MHLLINKCVTAVKDSNFSGHYLRNRSTLDIGVLCYIGIVQRKEHSPEFCPFLLGQPVYVRNVFFSCFGTPGIFGIPNGILQDIGTELFNTQKTGTVPVNAGRMGSLLFTTNWGRMCVTEANLHAWSNSAPEGNSLFQVRTLQVQAVTNCQTQWSARAVSNKAARTKIFQSLSCYWTVGSP